MLPELDGEGDVVMLGDSPGKGTGNEDTTNTSEGLLAAGHTEPNVLRANSPSSAPDYFSISTKPVPLEIQTLHQPNPTQKRGYPAQDDTDSTARKRITLSSSTSVDFDSSENGSPPPSNGYDFLGTFLDSDLNGAYGSGPFLGQVEIVSEANEEAGNSNTTTNHNYKGLVPDDDPDLLDDDEPWYPYDSTQPPILQAYLEDWLKKEDPMICYGAIHQVRVKVLPTSTPLLDRSNVTRATFEDAQEKDLYTFAVHCDNTSSKCTLQPLSSQNHEPLPHENIAVLNTDACHILSSILNISTCNFIAYSPVKLWEGVINSNHGISKGQDKTILVDIVVYGHPQDCEEIGEVLACRNLYFQEPDFRDLSLEYKNPHFLDYDFMGTEIEDDLTGKVSLTTDIDLICQMDAIDTEVTMTPAALSKKVEEVFEKTTRAKSLKRVAADARIIPNLKPWQEEALDFITQREFGPIQDCYSLWQKETSDSYSHIITGSVESELPRETTGGILADEMGLGKTLTMLSAIVRTTDEAKKFESSCQNDASLTTEKVLVHSRATIVIVPSPLLLNEWLQEIKKHCTGFSNINIYHSQGREGNPKNLANSDIILSTFHTIAAEYRDKTSPLWKIKWFRIVLDEAHTIRRMTTLLFRAVSRLHAHLRWCLTGTPIQNSLDDLAALVSFIKAKPLDNLHTFKQFISLPLLKGSANSLENLRQLLDSVCLRRTQQLLQLPNLKFEPQLLSFSAREQKQYVDTKDKLIQLIKQNPFNPHKKGYLGVFQLQLQLRRLCNHGTFQKTSLQFDEFDPEQAIAHLKKHSEAVCVVCGKDVTGIHGIEEQRTGYFTTCGHLLCAQCVPSILQSLVKASDQDEFSTCSLCSKPVWGDYIICEEMSKSVSGRGKKKGSRNLSAWQYFDKEGYSTKVSALVANIEKHKADEKSIVFSCWTRSLDLVGIFLNSRNIPFVRIDGSHTLKQRADVLRYYENDPTIRVLLMTTGTGSVGLNLTNANCVHILEPQWNPMVESQAIARVNRLGQTRNVRVVTYIMKDTVELELQSQQIRKLEYAKVGWKEQCSEEA